MTPCCARLPAFLPHCMLPPQHRQGSRARAAPVATEPPPARRIPRHGWAQPWGTVHGRRHPSTTAAPLRGGAGGARRGCMPPPQHRQGSRARAAPVATRRGAARVPGVTTGQPFRSPYHRRRRVGERNPVLRPSAGQWEAMGSIAMHRPHCLASPCIARHDRGTPRGCLATGEPRTGQALCYNRGQSVFSAIPRMVRYIRATAPVLGAERWTVRVWPADHPTARRDNW